MGAPVEEFGPYLVYEQIGLGGMASVHRAEMQGIAGFRRPVALKRMLPHLTGDASLVKSFVREARLASHLRHANVAQTLDLGKVGEIYFIAMELVPGHNLREIQRHCMKTAGTMPLAIALNILNQICDALDYAHNLCDETGQPLGIIHRDVSPANVIVSDGGVVKLIDFGIAKASAMGMQTMSGTIKGKFGYMAPEYLAGTIDARADLFALGVIGHELLANRPLFQGKDDMDTLFRVKEMPIEPPSRFNPLVPPEVDAIILTALERDPDRRWQRATALRNALTTETQRLGLHMINQHVADWVDDSFARIEDSAPEISVSQGTAVLGADPDGPDTVTKMRRSAPVQAQAVQHVEHRPSSPHVVRRGSPSRMMPTAASSSAIQVSASAVIEETAVSAVLRDLDERSSIAPAMPHRHERPSSLAMTHAGAGPARARGVLVALFVLLAAAATAGVVYFVLPYFT